MPSTSILTKSGSAVRGDQRIQRGGRHLDPLVPAHPGEGRHPRRLGDEARRPGGHGGRAGADEQRHAAGRGRDRLGAHGDLRVAPEQPAEEAGEVGLRLDRDDAGAQPRPGARAVADMGADVEAEARRRARTAGRTSSSRRPRPGCRSTSTSERPRAPSRRDRDGPATGLLRRRGRPRRAARRWCRSWAARWSSTASMWPLRRALVSR